MIGMIAVPIYIRFLGVEGYGLVGFYGALRTVFNSFLDFGLSVTIKRDVARYMASPAKIAQTRDLVRTMEGPYWLIGVFLGFVVYLAAPAISTYWINSEMISVSIIEDVIVIMALITFVQWPLTFYQGGLIGLQKIVLLNGVNVIISTLRSGGSIFAVWLFPSPMIAFFYWQVIVSVIQLSITAILMWHNLPPSLHPPRFQKSIIKEIWRFALGMSGTSIFAFLLTQGDKILLSKILTLEHFGYYSIAATLNEQLQLVNAQIVQPLFPQFSSLIAVDNWAALREHYHKACQLVSVIILPIAGVAAFFSQELIYLWTNDQQLASIVAPIATLLFAGTALLNIIDIPVVMAIAYGWVRFTFYRGLVLSILFVPLLVVLSLEYAGTGAALAWLLLNLGQLLVLPPVIHRKILPGELKQWYVNDVGVPLISSFLVLIIARWLMPVDSSTFQNFVFVGLVAVVVFVVAFLSAKESRKWGKELLKNLSFRLNA